MLLLFLCLGCGFLLLYWLVVAFWGCFYCVCKVFMFSLTGWCLRVNSVVFIRICLYGLLFGCV